MPAQLAKLTSVANILVLKWSAMGDLAIASCAFEDIRNAYPEASITLDTLPPWQRLYEADPRFDKVQCFDLRRRGLRAAKAWLHAVQRAHYDLVIDLQTTDRSRAMIGLANFLGPTIRYRAGNRSCWPYNLPLPATPQPLRNALQIATDTIASAGIEAKTTYPHLHVDRATREATQTLLKTHVLEKGRFAVFLPGCQAAGYLKRWGTHHYAQLAEQLTKREIDQIVLLGGPDEIEECRAIAKMSRAPILNLCGQTELLQVGPLCEQARLIVANDTGTAHLAATANQPMVVVCGPTDPRRVLPAGHNVHAAQLELPCVNCYRKHCAHHSCMRLLTPAMVMQKIDIALNAVAD
jgi:lipopolysaccharide heptosyltransferase II